MIFLEVPEAKEVQIVSDIHRKSWHETYDGILPPEKIEEILVRSEPAQIEHFREVARGNRPDHFLLVARNEGEVVGFCDMKNDGSVADVKAIYILKQFQRRGIGTEMIKRFLEWAQVPKKMQTDVLLENRPAVRFFEKHGFHADADLESIGGIKILTMRYSAE